MTEITNAELYKLFWEGLPDKESLSKETGEDAGEAFLDRISVIGEKYGYLKLMKAFNEVLDKEEKT